MENLLSIPPKGKKLAIEEELIKGREMANQLLEMLNHKSNTHYGEDEKKSKSSLFPFVEDLVREVLKSLTNTLLLLNNNEPNHVAAPPISVGDLSFPVGFPKVEDLEGTYCRSLSKQNLRSRSNKRK